MVPPLSLLPSDPVQHRASIYQKKSRSRFLKCYRKTYPNLEDWSSRSVLAAEIFLPLRTLVGGEHLGRYRLLQVRGVSMIR